jgi:antirestriction protein ArdC
MSERLNETFTRIFIEKIEARRAAGENVVAPWRKPWNPALGMDRNIQTDKPYRGSNVWMTAVQGFSSPFWGTIKQINKLGGKVKKGESYTPIFYWWFPNAEEREAGRMPFCKFYKVWNVEQTTGLEAIVAERLAGTEDGTPVNPIEAAQAIVDGWHGCPEIAHGGNRAAYHPGSDKVHMPEMQAFESAEAYYHTLYHELAHSTGHRTRLERDGVVNPARFGSHDYSEEELIAEMSAGMLAGYAGIAHDDENSAAYLDHWLAKLKREPSWLAQAGGAAQKAVDMIRGISWEKAD